MFFLDAVLQGNQKQKRIEAGAEDTMPAPPELNKRWLEDVKDTIKQNSSSVLEVSSKRILTAWCWKVRGILIDTLCSICCEEKSLDCWFY